MSMNKENLLKILLAPHISEKSSSLADKHGQYVFRVMPDATKTEIKAAVEMLFNVKVRAVNTVNISARERRFGQTAGKQKGFAKAYVTLQAGEKIDLAGAQA
jgi:large subunit ribosomal protein L23